MDSDNQFTERLSINNKQSLNENLENKLSISGWPLLTEKVSFGRISGTDLSSFGRQSSIGYNFQYISTRPKTSLLQKEIEENSRNLKNFILNQNIFFIDPLFEKKQFNYATETNFLEYLQIIVYHIDKDYQCTNLQDDLNFFLNLFDLESLQETIFKNITNNWKYIVDGFVKLIKIIEFHYNIFKVENYDENNFLNYLNDLPMLDILNKTIQNMGLSDDCKLEHYEDSLKCYTKNCNDIYLTDNNNLENLKQKVKFLQRKKKEHENVYRELETQSYKLDLMNKDIENLNNNLISNDKYITNIREELNKKISWIENKNNEIIKINEEWIITKDKINNQKISKEEARQLFTNTAIISNRIDILEEEIKLIKRIYNEKCDKISDLQQTIDIKSRSFTEQLIKIYKSIYKNTLSEDIDYKYLDISGDLNQTINYYKTTLSCMIENSIEMTNKFLILKEEVFFCLKNNIKNMINDCETL
ncbi:Hypothetical protein SRAE_2000027300 [Strongyloides ratti]|uniref:Uncharacterized protein n=1 Tax=Strongyloides ratti TaxID=34506 RepID=A0A090L736_STRRB|nr:Hypothetical protein SRAE_2000027300 [Strongyloides ratti]CEF65596.1 Hypothetical protein SRAE_2000027300 [Strongyloides ratti]